MIVPVLQIATVFPTCTVLPWQTLVSREKDPLDPAVVTVGSIHGGTRYNIIPDEVKLQLTVRSFKPEVRKLLLDGIQRIAKAEAAAASAPKEPEFKFSEAQASTYNDPVVTRRLAAVLAKELGADNVQEARPEMVAETSASSARRPACRPCSCASARPNRPGTRISSRMARPSPACTRRRSRPIASAPSRRESARWSSPRWSCSAAADQLARGSVTRNVAPGPRPLTTDASPAWSRASSRTIQSPSP